MFFSTENQEKVDKAKAETPEEPASAKPAPKAKRGSPKEAAPAFMASFLAGLEVYKAKMLVRKAWVTFLDQLCPAGNFVLVAKMKH